MDEILKEKIKAVNGDKLVEKEYSKFTNYRHDAQLGSKSSFLAFFEAENEFLRPKNVIERRDDN